MPHDYLKLLRPNPGQGALLRAALLDGEAARSAHAEWRKGVVLDEIDQASNRLLPLLAENLGRLGIADPDMPRLRGIRRRQLYHNRTLLHGIEHIVKRLDAAGIPVLLLKGAAICAAVRHDWSVRYMGDIDLLVPQEYAAQAWDEFDREGWDHASQYQDLSNHSRVIESLHAIGFQNSRGTEIDLHWRSIAQRERPNQEEAFWRDAIMADAAGLPVRVLSPSHQLFHVLAHAVFWSTGHSLDWIADSHAILTKTPNQINWSVLVQFARQRAIAHTLRAQLTWLRDELSLPIPAPVLAELADSPVHWSEKALGWGRHQRFVGLWVVRSRWHDRLDESFPAHLAGIWKELAWHYNTPVAWLPLVLAWRVIRRGARATSGWLVVGNTSRPIV